MALGHRARIDLHEFAKTTQRSGMITAGHKFFTARVLPIVGWHWKAKRVKYCQFSPHSLSNLISFAVKREKRRKRAFPFHLITVLCESLWSLRSMSRLAASLRTACPRAMKVIAIFEPREETMDGIAGKTASEGDTTPLICRTAVPFPFIPTRTNCFVQATLVCESRASQICSHEGQSMGGRAVLIMAKALQMAKSDLSGCERESPTRPGHALTPCSRS